MADLAVVSVEILRKLLEYDPDTGFLTWKPRGREFFRRDADQKTWNAKFAGRQAFNQRGPGGYLVSEIFNRPYRAHRVAWALSHGEWASEIDHINGDRADNRIANLRAVTRSENSRNAARSRRNRSGVVGVSVDTLTGKWRAQIGVAGRARFLGLFETLDEAVAARRRAEVQYGFHPNHGRDALLGAEQRQ